MKLTIGMRVFWSDPDPIEGCANVGVIVQMQHVPPMADSVISIEMDDGGSVEAFPHELTPVEEAT